MLVRLFRDEIGSVGLFFRRGVKTCCNQHSNINQDSNQDCKRRNWWKKNSETIFVVFLKIHGNKLPERLRPSKFSSSSSGSSPLSEIKSGMATDHLVWSHQAANLLAEGRTQKSRKKTDSSRQLQGFIGPTHAKKTGWKLPSFPDPVTPGIARYIPDGALQKPGDLYEPTWVRKKQTLDDHSHSPCANMGVEMTAWPSQFQNKWAPRVPGLVKLLIARYGHFKVTHGQTCINLSSLVKSWPQPPTNLSVRQILDYISNKPKKSENHQKCGPKGLKSFWVAWLLLIIFGGSGQGTKSITLESSVFTVHGKSAGPKPASWNVENQPIPFRQIPHHLHEFPTNIELYMN